ncbi:ATP-binding protein [uncultured Piscinibacter sp.]|uniref:sensor histidine kinase n=1 Tax=uncultured Piscinibacter sp. TaxID=1131835 RepID=UPI0026355BAC|nr:ATP-binding protein [uncultured Piscinibacter sp.]
MLPADPLRTAAHFVFVVVLAFAAVARAAPPPNQLITQALAVASNADRFPEGDPSAITVALPDDWSETHPRHDGAVWYRVHFDPGLSLDRTDLLGLFIERACSHLDVYLNGQRIHSSGRASDPAARDCHYPQLASVPGGLVLSQGNVLDLHVRGHALQNVASRERAGGMSALRIGAYDDMAELHASALLSNVTMVKIVNLSLAMLGIVMVALAWVNRRDAPLGYFGLMAVGMALLSARAWWRSVPLDNATVEFLVCLSFAPVLALAVQFLLSYAGVRSRMIEAALLAQCVVLPMSLLLAGPTRLFAMTSAWYLVLALETLGTMLLHLRLSWRDRSGEFWPMAVTLAATSAVLLYELAVQRGWLPLPPAPRMQVLVPLILIAFGLRLLVRRAGVQATPEVARHALDVRVREITGEIERSHAQLAEMRIEQVTAKERKRIAADLHDDLGAKLLTIVHTSESERISTLAREALEEMRLSVRGLTGKPVRLSDALADWRAETVMRLGQANIEIDWKSLAEDTEQVLPARGYVQTTRILREAVSNIIKHSGASHVKVRCAIADGQFGINIQDNGKGIPMELDGKLDRGHGMSSMKHRAKQMQGQCLVESGPGYGTVIRLTLPLGPEVPAAPSH